MTTYIALLRAINVGGLGFTIPNFNFHKPFTLTSVNGYE
jgi:hypothetical protein